MSYIEAERICKKVVSLVENLSLTARKVGTLWGLGDDGQFKSSGFRELVMTRSSQTWKKQAKCRLWSHLHPAIPLLGRFPEKLKAKSQEDMCAPMFIAALFATAKRRKLPKFWWINDKPTVAHTDNGMIFSLQKGGNSGTCYNMDETSGHYAKCNEPVPKRPIHTAGFQSREVPRVVNFRGRK